MNGLADSGYLWLEITVNDTASPGPLYGESGPSCRLNMTGAQARRVALPSLTPRGHAQCGNVSLEPTTGLTALVTQIGTGTEGSTGSTRVVAQWLTSLSDPMNTTSGNYSYWWTETLSLQPLGPSDCICGIDTTDANDANGKRYHRFDLSATPQTATYDVIVEDPFTRAWSNRSCTVSVSTAQFFAQNNCGTFGDSSGDAPTGSPAFPGLNVTLFQTTTGFQTAPLLWFLAGVFILAVAIGSFRVAGPPGGIIGAILAIPAVVTLNLIAQWWIVVLFMAAATVFVLYLGRGGGE